MVRAGFIALVGLALAGCCNRGGEGWVAGKIVVTFKAEVPRERAEAAVNALGYTMFSYDQQPPVLGIVTVPGGQECYAEWRLRQQPEVNSALQDTYLSDR